jgi:hypothetical protein
MPTPTTVAQPVLSQRIERDSASSTGYFVDLLVWLAAVIVRQEWKAVNVPQEHANPFDAVRHEHRISNHPVVVREEDSPMGPIATNAAIVERYRGPRGRLLTFKKR